MKKNKYIKNIIKLIHKLCKKIRAEESHTYEKIESDFGVKTQREPDAGFCFISYKWASGNSLNSVLKGSDMSVGDFVRSTKQLVDLLNQIGGASEKLRPVCKDAVKRIDRGVVAYLMGDI